MRCSVSPFSRASAVCMLMQLAQPLIGDARICTSSARLGSRLALIAAEVPNQFFISEGAAAKRSSAVMIGFLLWFRHHDEAGSAGVTSAQFFLRSSSFRIDGFPRFYGCIARFINRRKTLRRPRQ